MVNRDALRHLLRTGKLVGDEERIRQVNEVKVHSVGIVNELQKHLSLHKVGEAV